MIQLPLFAPVRCKRCGRTLEVIPERWTLCPCGNDLYLVVKR